jgi:NhaP-type Na+/H+ or K+/H+ antiporter
MSESIIFLYLGLGLLSFESKTTYSPAMIFFAVIAILAGRTHVFWICGANNAAAKKQPNITPIPQNQQILMWFSGLRGAVAFALGVVFLEHPTFDESVKGMIFGTTVMVVVITILFLGGLTPYMLTWLKITDGNAEGHGAEADGNYMQLEEEINEAKQSSKTYSWLYTMDQK